MENISHAESAAGLSGWKASGLLLLLVGIFFYFFTPGFEVFNLFKCGNRFVERCSAELFAEMRREAEGLDPHLFGALVTASPWGRAVLARSGGSRDARWWGGTCRNVCVGWAGFALLPTEIPRSRVPAPACQPGCCGCFAGSQAWPRAPAGLSTRGSSCPLQS